MIKLAVLTSGDKLVEARKAANMSQTDVARATGITVPQISSHENGRTGLSLVMALLYAKTYNVKVEDLVETVSLA